MKPAFLLAIAILLSPLFAAEFFVDPYLYQSEKGAAVDVIPFVTGNNSSAKLIKIGGEEAFLLINEKPVADKNEISLILLDYYRKNFYPSDEDLGELARSAKLFNDSRNYMTRYGPAEKICVEGGTFLAYRPCHDYKTCYETASMKCSIDPTVSCIIDVLAAHITPYAQGILKLDAAYAKFSGAYLGLGPATMTSSLTHMNEAFDAMKSAGEEVSKTKLRLPESGFCGDCLGICPSPHFDYNAINTGKAKVAALLEKTKPYAGLEQAVERIYLSTQDREKYRAGEERAAIFKPKYDAVQAKFGGLQAQAVEAKALIADSDFVSAANAFLNKGEELQQKLDGREFDGFDSLLSGYDTAGKKLFALMNNSTSPYKSSLDAQDSASDSVTEAYWGVNRLSKTSVEAYNSLAERKNKLDAKFKPPMTSGQYGALESDYQKLKTDAQAYLAASSGFEGSVFGVGNTLGRTSVDGAMALASSMAPISFKTRQSFAKYVPPLVLAVVDLSILSAGMLVFLAAFYYFHGFFRSRIAVSGWALSMLAFVFILLAGSVGFYSIVLSTEKFATFSDFYGTLRASDRVAVIVEDAGASQAAAAAMRSCADQIEAQLKPMGKQTLKYYISGNTCTSVLPKAPAAGNSTNSTNSTALYETKSGLASADCLNNMPDVPFFDLQYSQEVKPPSFTTVVSRQAIFKGNEEYFAKKPLCDAANVLG